MLVAVSNKYTLEAAMKASSIVMIKYRWRWRRFVCFMRRAVRPISVNFPQIKNTNPAGVQNIPRLPQRLADVAQNRPR